MSPSTVFYQECPICGRNLRVPVKYFGRQMSCSHCHGEFVAGENELPNKSAMIESPSAMIIAPVFGQAQLGEA